MKIPLHFLRLAWPLSFLLIRAAAQDVTVSGAGWFTTEALPDTPPQVKGRWRPGDPKELRKVEDTGYVIVAQFIDADAKRTSGDH